MFDSTHVVCCSGVIFVSGVYRDTKTRHKGALERQKRYIGQIWGAVNHYNKCLQTDSILIGDFNSNAIWDEIKRIGNHTDVVSFLAGKNIHSIYHKQFNCNHGEETDPTLFLQKNFVSP